MTQQARAPMPKWRVILNMMLSPGNVLKSTISKVSWKFSVIVSAVAFMLFFLQTGLDLYKTMQKDMLFVILSALKGAVYGGVAIPLLAGLVWSIARLFKSDKDIKWVISSFCLSYSGALIYGICGICFSLILGWRTSVAFGITGVLWATGPLMAVIREMTGAKAFVSIIISTIVGVIVLFSWYVLGGA